MLCTDFLCPWLVAENKVYSETKKKKTNGEIEAVWKKKNILVLGS